MKLFLETTIRKIGEALSTTEFWAAYYIAMVLLVISNEIFITNSIDVKISFISYYIGVFLLVVLGGILKTKILKKTNCKIELYKGKYGEVIMIITSFNRFGKIVSKDSISFKETEYELFKRVVRLANKS